jgi:hypothetical protein
VTLPEPELDVGADDGADTPLPGAEVLELPEPVLPEPVLLELPDEPVLDEPVLDEPVLELPDEPVLDEPVLDEPVLDELRELLPVPDVVAELAVAPGKAKATAPAATALTTPAVTVTARSRACPRSRAAIARRVSGGGPLMGGVPASLASWTEHWRPSWQRPLPFL